jgi:hypothetical protein
LNKAAGHDFLFPSKENLNAPNGMEVAVTFKYSHRNALERNIINVGKFAYKVSNQNK